MSIQKWQLLSKKDVAINSKQHVDDTEQIEVVELDFHTMDRFIQEGKIFAALTIAGWELAKKKFPHIFT